MRTIKGGAFTGTGTAASYTVPTVRQSAYRARSPAFHRGNSVPPLALFRSRSQPKGRGQGNKRVLSVSVYLSLSLSLPVSFSLSRAHAQDSLLAAISNPKKPARSFDNLRTIVCFPYHFGRFCNFFRGEKKKKGETKIKPCVIDGRSIRLIVPVLFFDCFIIRLLLRYLYHCALYSTEAENLRNELSTRFAYSFF